jgi:hypothetical protein
MRTPFRRILALVTHPATVTLALAACVAGLYVLERQAAHMPYVVSVLFVIAGLVFLVSARPAFSLYCAMGVMSLTSLMSVAKYRAKGFDLHVYDFVFTGTDREAIRFLFAEFGHLIIPLVAVLVAAIAGLGLIAWYEKPSRLRLPMRLAIPGVFAAVLPLAYPVQAGEPRYFHYLGGFNASSFYISFLDLPIGGGALPIAARLENAPGAAAFDPADPCGGPTDRPDIFVVLSESTVDPSQFPGLDLEAELGDAFRSRDGKKHNLQVETFGGGTWVTNLSLMTGLSSTDFGWQAPYLTVALENRVHESIPMALARCGYRTAALIPMKDAFVNEGPFMRSIGFGEVLDHDAIGASEYAHRDSFYFEAAERFIRDHRENDGRPLFLQIQTMFAHSPYSEVAAPEAGPVGNWTGDAEIDEYLRRVVISQSDFREFRAKRSGEAVAHPSVVLEFGDHQSAVTKPLLGDTGGADLADLASAAYRTYYTVHGYGHPLDMRHFGAQDLDIVYLGASLLQATGIPLSPMFAEMAKLRDTCGGRFQLCADRTAIDRHLQRRVASGLLTLDQDGT